MPKDQLGLGYFTVKVFPTLAVVGAATNTFPVTSAQEGDNSGMALERAVGFLIKITGAGASSVTTITVEGLDGSDVYVVAYDFYAADGTYTADTKTQATAAGATGNLIVNLPKAPCLQVTRLKLVNSGVAPNVTYDVRALIKELA